MQGNESTELLYGVLGAVFFAVLFYADRGTWRATRPGRHVHVKPRTETPRPAPPAPKRHRPGREP